jgi:hypothetical protein
MNAISNQIGSKVRTVVHYGLPTIEFHIDDCDGPRRVIPSYSTMDTIAGHVSITAAFDTRFDDLDIAFIGKYIHSIPRSTPSNIHHRHKPDVRRPSNHHSFHDRAD